MASSARGARQDLERWRIRETDTFSKRVTKASKLASVSLQRKIDQNIDRPTNFTKNAVGFKFKVDRLGTTNTIFIKDAQAGYLSHLIDDNSPFSKFVPVPGKTNQFGNIAGLKSKKGLESVEQKHNGSKRTILIKTKAKRKNRLIAIYKPNQSRRKVLGSWTQICTDLEKTINRVATNR